MMVMSKYLTLFLKIVAAFIMVQTLFFKFSGAQESVNLFTQIAGKHESILRILTGVIELIASILLFIPKKTWLGAILTIGVMAGAITTHLTKIGISYNNDGGTLFIMAVITFSIGIILFLSHKKDSPFMN